LGAIPRFDQRQLSRHTAQEFSGHDVNAVLIENFQKCIATRFWALLQFEKAKRSKFDKRFLAAWMVRCHRRFQPDHHCFELLPGAAFSFPKNDALQGLT